MLLTIDERKSKMVAMISVFDCNCRQGDKWQSKPLFLMIFDLRSSIVKIVFDCRLSGVKMRYEMQGRQLCF